MVFYFSEQFASARIGVRIVGVECDQCRNEYFFELARIGAGSATAAYGLGRSAAQSSAETQSEVELAERLAEEAELVPCPHCHWISEDLVRGYRNSRYRGLVPLAGWIAFVGITACLIGAWFVSLGPPADRGALPYLLYIVPGTFLALALVTIPIRAALRSQIQPNRSFPRPPVLPPGSPPALLYDADADELRPAQKALPATQAERFGEVYDFQIGRHSLPAQCSVCLQEPTPGCEYERQVTPAIKLQAPRCATCARAAVWTWRKIYWLSVLAVVPACYFLLWMVGLEQEMLWILFVAIGLVALAALAFVASALTAPFVVVGSDMSRGVLRLRFRHPDYRPREARESAEEIEG